MSDPLILLTDRVRAAITTAFGAAYSDVDPCVRPAQNPRFGDYQANVAMALAKRLGEPPRAVASAIVERLNVAELCSDVQIAGPGFINLTLRTDFLGRCLLATHQDPRLGVAPVATPQTVVVDYSSPNVAKEMHVGHLRSTVIGDALARTLEFLGHRVLRHNHLGDWGTQFGMLIEHLLEVRPSTTTAAWHIQDLNAFYQQAKQRFDSDVSFAEKARRRVVALQAGDGPTLALWRELVQQSKQHFNAVYERLGVTLRDEHLRPESYYNPMLASVVAELAPLIQHDGGALCIFVPGFKGPTDQPVPLIVQKSDGGFGYAATDLAALRDRSCNLGAERIIYVVDARQSDHFAMVFWVAAQMGWRAPHAPAPVQAEHCRFGTILGPDNKPFKTRSGGTVRLADLLNEAIDRARAIVAEKNHDLDDAEQAEIARVVGTGAVKYGDLASDRIKDYVFSWERMLAMDGNTAPYLQYAYARLQAIFRKVAAADAASEAPAPAVEAAAAADAPLLLTEPEERALALKLLQFGAVVEAVAARLEPHHLCTYLYELAANFSTFYNACPVLRASTAPQRHTRLLLCSVTARLLRLGLDLLGIEVLDRM